MTSSTLAGTHAVLLAAGAGTRFGGGKLLSEWRGEPLVKAAARIALASPAERVTVVVGHDAPAVSRVLLALDDDRLVTVVNARWGEGLSSSLKAGLRSLPRDAERVILFLGDMPLVDPRLAALLIDQLGAAPAVLPTHRGGPAHPAVFRAAVIPQLLKIVGDGGARAVLASLPGARVVEVGDAGATIDIDTPADALLHGAACMP